MSYDPSHRKPRHAGRMPQVITPEEAWPALDGSAYPDGAGYRDGGQGAPEHQDVYWSAPNYQNPSYQDAYPGYGDHAYRGATTGYRGTGHDYQQTSYDYSGTADDYPQTRDGYTGNTNGYPQTRNDYAGTTNGYAGTTDDYTRTSYGYAGRTDAFHHSADAFHHSTGDNADGWGDWAMDSNGTHRELDGYGTAADDFDGNGYHRDYDGYAEPAAQDPRLMAPDAGLDPGGWRTGRGTGERRGLIVGAVTGFLAAGTAIGVATLAAAFVRPQASPIIAVGEAFIDRTPSSLKNFAIQRFGENDKTMLLLGMYVAIALLAMGIGILARRTATLGAVGIAAFSLFGAYVAITRPASRASDVIPSVIGGIAGVAALLWLERASTPIATTPSPRSAVHGRRAAR